jgi:hypothetical protein
MNQRTYLQSQIKNITPMGRELFHTGELASKYELYIRDKNYLIYVTDADFARGEFTGDMDLALLAQKEPELIYELLSILKHFKITGK